MRAGRLTKNERGKGSSDTEEFCLRQGGLPGPPSAIERPRTYRDEPATLLREGFLAEGRSSVQPARQGCVVYPRNSQEQSGQQGEL